MNKYNDLEMTVLSCLLQKPEFMKTTKLKDEHFKSHKRLWKFMQIFYEKYQTFDFNLMYAVVSDKYRFMDYMVRLVDFEILPNNFEKYEDMLILKCYEDEKEQWIIEQVFGLANKLYVKSINLDEFKLKCNKIYSDADVIFKKERNNE